MDRFTAPYNASLKPLESLSLNLWAATVEEELGAGVPPTQRVYYVAWYDGSYRIFTDPASLPADLLRDRDYSGMPLPEEPKPSGGKKPEPGPRNGTGNSRPSLQRSRPRRRGRCAPCRKPKP